MSAFNVRLSSTCESPVDTDIHVGVIGLIVELTFYDGEIIADISSSTLQKIFFKKPDGVILEKVASFTTDGSDGKVRYSTILNDIDVPGIWQVQGYFESPVYTGYSSIAQFEVHANFR